MKSPFPGMDPYLEARWSDVHVKLVAYVGEALQPLLPRGLRARSEARVLLENVQEEALSSYRSDVAVVESRDGRTATATSVRSSLAEPVLVAFFNEPEVDRFVQIIDTTSGNRVVTVIEILSPWNKGAGELNKQYRQKLKNYRRASVNVVEIDLLRSPRERLEVGQVDMPPNRRAPYLTGVWRVANPLHWALYPMPLRQPLPPLPIPLRDDDADVVLELQPLIERVYVAGGHDDIDYRKPPRPPLEGEDAAWADELLRAARKR